MARDDDEDYASLLWDRAEECRAISAIVTTDAQLKADYLMLANSYLELANEEERLRLRKKKDGKADKQGL